MGINYISSNNLKFEKSNALLFNEISFISSFVRSLGTLTKQK